MNKSASGTRGQTPEDRLRLTPAPTFAPGDPVPGLNSWVLERRLGGGGFGEVWLARHAFDDEQELRAVKFCTDPLARHRLVTHERNVVVRVMSDVGRHPNIVRLRECNLDGELPWLMYEFVEGGTLAELVAAWRALPPTGRLGRAVPVLHALATALAACHRLSPPLVHRDLKPQNVLMAGPVPRITDFGIGGAVGARGAVHTARLPTDLHGAGTHLYAPPEQMLGALPSPRDDVYALGVIAYQSVTGDLRAAPGADVALELRDLGVPDPLAALIARSVAFNPDRRPKDGGEWEAGIAALVAQLPPEEPAPGELPHPPPVEQPAPRTELPRPAAVTALARARGEPSPERSRLARAIGAVAELICSALTAGFSAYFLLTSRGPGDGAAPDAGDAPNAGAPRAA